MASSIRARPCRRSSVAPNGAGRTCTAGTCHVPRSRASRMTDFIDDLCERVRDHSARKAALRIRGSGSKDFYGEASEGETPDMSAYAGIVAYDPQELVLTARAGTRLPEVESELPSHRQILSFEPPQFGVDATIGSTGA